MPNDYGVEWHGRINDPLSQGGVFAVEIKELGHFPKEIEAYFRGQLKALSRKLVRIQYQEKPVVLEFVWRIDQWGYCAIWVHLKVGKRRKLAPKGQRKKTSKKPTKKGRGK